MNSEPLKFLAGKKASSRDGILSILRPGNIVYAYIGNGQSAINERVEPPERGCVYARTPEGFFCLNYRTLGEMERDFDILKPPFLRACRNVLVNPSYVTGRRSNMVVLSNGDGGEIQVELRRNGIRVFREDYTIDPDRIVYAYTGNGTGVITDSVGLPKASGVFARTSDGLTNLRYPNLRAMEEGFQFPSLCKVNRNVVINSERITEFRKPTVVVLGMDNMNRGIQIKASRREFRALLDGYNLTPSNLD